ncbi:hypothetical protein J5285_03090 [Agrobacterium larrymoorei]|uniref:DUF982 domain-containing protein n=1 Tax=Agrobacterium larrymoorei TaxID=160699 RepID=A0ABX8T6H5_9HYPH|nr:hypothetical protein J5285_03090 [Agrobacterium larrymoorei]
MAQAPQPDLVQKRIEYIVGTEQAKCLAPIIDDYQSWQQMGTEAFLSACTKSRNTASETLESL